jgi:hypothetical protein
MMIAHKRTLCDKLACFCRNFVQHRQTPGAAEELARLNDLRAQYSAQREKKQHCFALPDLIDQVQEHVGARHHRQSEHQARKYWQNAYPDERPTDLINGENVNEPVYIANERLNAIRYYLTEPKRTPLHED